MEEDLDLTSLAVFRIGSLPVPYTELSSFCSTIFSWTHFINNMGAPD